MKRSVQFLKARRVSFVHRRRPEIRPSLRGRRCVLSGVIIGGSEVTKWLINLMCCLCFNYSFLCEQAYFAKYDAVELYLSRRTYPPGLSYVEKNTFRRFCKKFAIKGLYKPEPELQCVNERRQQNA